MFTWYTCAAVLAHPPAGDAVEHDLAWDVEVDHEVERVAVEDPLELLGLGQRAREAVEHEAVARADRRRRALLDDADHDLVGDELAGVHVALGLEPERGALRDRGAEHVARREVRDAVVLGEPRGLRALSGTLLAEQHEARPRSRSCSGQEPFVVAHHQLAVDLLHRLEHDAHGDQDRRAAERELVMFQNFSTSIGMTAMTVRNSAPGSVMRFSTLAR